MTRSEKIRLCYGIFLGVFTAVLGFLFIFEAAELYASGVTEISDTGMYSRAAVRERFLRILPAVILYILSVIAGAVLFECLPAGAAKRRSDPFAVFLRLKGRVPRAFGGEYGGLYARFARRERIRLCVKLVCAAFCVLAAVMSAVRLWDVSSYAGKDLTGEVLSMLRGILPWVGAAFAAVLLVTAFEWVYGRRMLPAVKSLLVAGRGLPFEPSPLVRAQERAEAALSRRSVVWAVRGALLAAAVVLIAVGAANGEARIMLIKAINICTECIGLG